MNFCDKCGSILVPATENGKQVVKCPRCNEKISTKHARIKVSEKMFNEQKGEGVSEGEEQTLATISLEEPCEKCGNSKAYHWSLQTRASDEPETEFFRCTKCKHTWREYS